MGIIGMKWSTRSEMHTTMVRGDHKLSGNKYVLGKISGIADVIFGDKNMYCWQSHEKENVRYFTVHSKPWKYEKFKKRVEEFYPGLCEFDVILKRPSN